MLRISIENGPLTTRFKLEGKLSHEWVSEAEKAWTALAALDVKKKLVVDLFDVAYVDELGWKLLAQMRHTGATLLGSGPLMSALIEDIEDAEAAQEDLAGQSESGEEIEQ